MTPYFWKTNAFCKVPRLRPFVHVRPTCRGRTVWSNGGMILTGETAGLGEKHVGTVPLCTPQISHGRNVLRSNLELLGQKSRTDRLSSDVIKGFRIRDSNWVKCRIEMRQTDTLQPPSTDVGLQSEPSDRQQNFTVCTFTMQWWYLNWRHGQALLQSGDAF